MNIEDVVFVLVLQHDTPFKRLPIPPPDYLVERRIFLYYPLQLRYLTIRGFTEPKVVRTGLEPAIPPTFCRGALPISHLTIYPLRQLNGLAAISEVGVSCYFRTSWYEQESNLRHVDFQSTALPTELSHQI